MRIKAKYRGYSPFRRSIGLEKYEDYYECYIIGFISVGMSQYAVCSFGPGEIAVVGIDRLNILEEQYFTYK